jgi:hypothetical protein
LRRLASYESLKSQFLKIQEGETMKKKLYAVEQEQGPIYPERIRASSAIKAKEIYAERYGYKVLALKAQHLKR